MDTSVIILAAGIGKRMGGGRAKVLSKAHGRELISYVIETSSKLAPTETVVVTGYQREIVEDFILSDIKKRKLSSNIKFAFQEEQLGTGHAVMCALEKMESKEGITVILYGDVPLIKEETIKKLVNVFYEKEAFINVLTFDAPTSSSYGRIVKNEDGEFLKIVEKKDCTPNQLEITESNSGVYAVNTKFLREAVKQIKTNNTQKEYYLTDIVEIASKQGLKVIASKITDENEVQGVNSLEELEKVENILEKENKKKVVNDY
ncbi:MAG: NTP transferase domain-containing protein [Bdellovibrionota bacterium]